AEHCQSGWGEIEIHLHHGIKSPDTAENTRRAIVEFRDALARHGCLSRINGDSIPRYAFVHGNWALANSARGRFCGVDAEMKIESGALTSAYPPTLSRLHLWQRTKITVEGKPDWVFIKLHCHGMDPTDREAMLGNQIQSFLKELTEEARTSKYVLHFTTAREM